MQARCPDIDLVVGPPVELRSRPPPPAIRIVTTGVDFDQQDHSISATSSPINFAHSPASTCTTPVSFGFSSPGGYLQPMSPFTYSDVGNSPATSQEPPSPMLLPQDTMAHEVCLLSLSAGEEAKYLGPSSGVSFARMIFGTEYHESDSSLRDTKRHLTGSSADPAQLPVLNDCIALSKGYFDKVHLQYPFLHQPIFDACLRGVCPGGTGRLPQGFSRPTALFHVFLVLAIGASILSPHTGSNEGYYASALQQLDEITLTGTLQGAQSALLMAIYSLHATGGRNVWYLNAVIMATCIDLGLQRKSQVLPGEAHKAALRRRVFWSAYALDRSLCIALGRPFSIRDDSIDVELPYDTDNDEDLANPSLGAHSQSMGSSRSNFGNSIYIFRITRILSSIRSTLFRISHSAGAGTWSQDLQEWQAKTYQHLRQIHDQYAQNARRGSSGSLLVGCQLVELKLQEATQLLFRPSPVFTQISTNALQNCFDSAQQTIRIYKSLMLCSGPLYPTTRFSENSILLSGITLLYCHRMCREVRDRSGNLTEDINTCSSLLGELAQHWPTARESKARFDAYALTYTNEMSARMLAPHVGARRASGGSVRPFPAEGHHTLEVPGGASLRSSPSPREWYGAGPQSVEMGWAQNSSWDMQFSPEDMMTGGQEMQMMDMMTQDQDTAMWELGSEILQQQQQHHQQQQ